MLVKAEFFVKLKPVEESIYVREIHVARYG